MIHLLVLLLLQNFRIWLETRGGPRSKGAASNHASLQSLDSPSSPPQKRSRNEKALNSSWRQIRGPGGRFESKAAQQELIDKLIDTLVQHVPIDQPLDLFLLRRIQNMEMNIVLRKNQIRTLREALATGVYNLVINPTPGLFDDDDLYTICLPRGFGLFDRIRAPPVAISTAQRLRLAAQCHSVAELLAAFNRRDEKFIQELKGVHAEPPRTAGRRILPSTARSKDIAALVVENLPADQKIHANTLLAW